MISYDDFSKVEIRIGTVLRADDFPEARRPALKMSIDFGDLGIKKTSAQITALYSKEELVGRQVLAVTNFPPKQIANIMSECLVLGVVQGDEVVLVQPDRPVPNGQRIM